MAATKPTVRKTITHNETAPGPIQAAQIALVLMQVAKTSNWQGVVADVSLATRVSLTDRQQQLIEEHRGILPYLTRGGREGTLRSLIACSECDRVQFTSSGTAPTKCLMKLGCGGTPVKARSTQEPQPKTAAVEPIAA